MKSDVCADAMSLSSLDVIGEAEWPEEVSARAQALGQLTHKAANIIVISIAHLIVHPMTNREE